MVYAIVSLVGVNEDVCDTYLPSNGPLIIWDVIDITDCNKMTITSKMKSTPDDLEKILGRNERVEHYIKEKIYHPTIKVDSVAFTNERIILRHPHALGLKKDYTDYNYQDVANVVMKKGIRRSSLTCTLRLGGEPLSLDDLPNSDAEKAYGIIRENLSRNKTPSAVDESGTTQQ